MSSSSAVTFERRGHVLIITLNRPEVMNAINADMSLAAEEAINVLLDDPELRVGVLTGAGDHFCAGADLKEVAAGRPLVDRSQKERGFGGFMRSYVDKPVIAAVRGFALGGGTELMLCCDLAVVADDSKLGLPEVKRGIIAAGGGLIRLPRRIPFAIALEYAMTGSTLTADEALRWGLVNRVVPSSDVLSSAIELAEAIAANAPLAVAASKRVIHQSVPLGSDWSPDVWAFSDARIREVMASADAKEGPRAFIEKRRPEWTGQ